MNLKSLLPISLVLICLFASCGNDSTHNNNSIKKNGKREKNNNQSLPADELIADSITNQIITSSGYIWDAIDNGSGLYTNLAFYPNGTLRTTVYQMNGSMNNLTLITTLKGPWELAKDGKSVNGRYDDVNDVLISWQFNANYSSLTNDKGAVFNRIKAK